jgi:hypothetical protein
MKHLGLGRWLIVCSWLLAGCLRAYVQPDATQPSAELVLVRGGGSESNTFLAYSDDACTPDGSGTGLLGVVGVVSGSSKVVRVRTDTPILVKAAAYASAFRAQEFEQRYCVNVVSFVPRAGTQYQLRQDRSATSCATLVTEADTAQPPADLVRHPVRDSCKIR